jgi:hypothetical protein
MDNSSRKRAFAPTPAYDVARNTTRPPLPVEKGVGADFEAATEKAPPDHAPLAMPESTSVTEV